MEKQKGKLKHNFLKYRNITMEPPVAMDLSTDITRLFQVRANKKKRISEYMCESIKKTKMNFGVSCESSSPVLPIRPTTAKDFVRFLSQCPSVAMPRLLGKRIKKMIHVPALQETHSQLLVEMMKEAKEEYSNVLRCAGTNQKIKNCYPEVVYTLQPYKHLGRTDRYEEYLMTRKRLKCKWILNCLIIKKVFNECVTQIPHILCHLSFNSILEIDAIISILNEKAQNVSLFVYELYTSVQSIVNEGCNQKSEKVSSVLPPTYLFACTGILSVHVSGAITRTVSHVVSFTGSSQPYVNLRVTFERGLVLTPTAEEVTEVYHNFIDKIVDSAREIHVLQRHKVRGFENKYMPVCVTEEFISDSKREVTENVQRLYKPIMVYLSNISSDLIQIYPDINSKTFIESISDITFENGCQRIKYYREYLNKVAYIPDRGYFQIGQLFVSKYRTILDEGLKQNINDIFEKLCSQHLWEVTDLSESFDMIFTKANHTSQTTEELIEIGKYMGWIKNEHLDAITTRVGDSLTALCQIIDLGILTYEHIQLNADVINWLDRISPIVENYLVLFDQLKYEAEEKLQKVVEDVTATIKVLYPLLISLDDMDDLKRITSYLHFITLHMNRINEIEDQIVWINREEACLSFPKSTYSEFDDLKDYVFPFYHLLILCQEIQRNVSLWQDGPFENLKYDTTKTATESYYKELTELHKTNRKKLRQAQDENLPLKFKGTIDDPDIINWPAPLKLCGMVMRLLDDFKPSVNITKIICNKSLRKRHWKAMSDIAGVDITPNAGTTLRKMMKIDFYANLNEYEIISVGATKEKQLIDNLKSLELVWNNIEFCVTTFKETSILSELDEIEAVIDDQTIKILNMKSSVFVKPHEREVSRFHGRIRRVSTTLDLWSKVQSEWIRLLPIFSTKNLDHVIPKESNLFNEVVLVYNNFINMILEKRNVMKIVDTTDIFTSIETCLNNIEVVHWGVITYLGTIRQNFPRLFFLSDDELLTILSRPKLKSQEFLTKIFTGIHELIIIDTKITGIKSMVNEHVIFSETIDLNNNNKLEDLCLSIEQRMISSIKHEIIECYKLFKRNNIEQVLSKFPQQAIQVISQIFWTEHIKSSLGLIHNIKLRIYYQKLDNTVKEKIRMAKETDRSNLERLQLRNLIIDDLNLRSLIKKILDSSYVHEDQLDWEAHPKYYLEDGLVSVQLIHSKVDYMYEYLGNFTPIIITPLTDRCHRTLINAHQLHFSGLLQGADDTGKSETIKNLSFVFGVFFVTFSCFQNLNPSILMNLLIGSCLCGSWLCLENINLLESGVLSVGAQNLNTILSAVKFDLNRCYLGGTTIAIKSSWFVTACVKSTYSDKLLPDNLRVLFRGSTLISPDIEQIVETTCYSLGFLNAKSLSKKIICIYNTYKDLMMTQPYYFGLGTFKGIFYYCEDLRHKFPEEADESLIFNSIKAVFARTMSKDDLKIIDELLLQVFPDVQLFIENRKNIEELIFNKCQEKNIQFNKEFSGKVIEIYDSLKKAAGLIVMGDTFTGKTTILNICEHLFMQLENKPVMKSTVNPNSLSYDDLYGKYNGSSLYCSDGVLPKILRNSSVNEEHAMRWLVLDGNIDTSWIENVNDILNYNKLYLASGETLNTNGLSLIFEVKNLNSASPSTISRCGLVFLAQSTITWSDFVKSWITSCKSEWIEDYRKLIINLLNWIIPPCLNFIKNNCTQFIEVNNINLVKNLIHIMHLTLDDAYLSIARKEEDIKNLFIWIQATLIIAGITGMGSVLDKNSMTKFDEFYKLLWKGQNTENPYPASFEKLEVLIPQDGLLCNYQHIFKQRGIWKLHQDLLKNEKIVEHPYMDGFLVPTVDTLKYNTILMKHIDHQYPVIIIGPSGTGKSILIEHNLLNNIDREKYDVSHINFNCYTNSKQTQRYVISKLNKRKNGRYSPPKDKNFLLFIDNLNLITMDQHDTADALELLRQYLDNEVWYDLKNYNPIHLQKINMILAMNPNEMSKKRLCNRFLRHFHIFSINEFSDDNISRIYANILLYNWKRAGFSGDIGTIISQIVSGTTRMYHLIMKRFKPTLKKNYYIFGLSNFSKVINTCASLKKETYDNNKKIYINLWSHEIQRVFGDRLDDIEFETLLEDIRNITKEEFHEEEESRGSKSLDSNCKFKTIFSTFNDRELPSNERRYEELTDIPNLQNTVADSLNIYNAHHAVPLDLVLFSYALEKLLKICRILSSSPSNVLLLGAHGSGRQSLTKLACHLYKQELFQPTLTTKYTISDWDSDVKSILKEAGGREKECVFLVTEEQLIDELFLQNIDLLLRNGEIPNLYNTEETQEILELARLSAQGGNRNLDISSAAVFLYFHKRCKENLHIVLCHSVNSILRNRIRKHPSLTSCHIIWFDDWPNESFEFVAQTWIKDSNLTNEVKRKVIEASIFFHREAQIFSQESSKKRNINMQVNSMSFMHLIKLFIELTRTKQKEIGSTKKSYEQGLARLSHAANQILNMQKSLAEFQPQLEEMTQKAIEMTEQIALETIQVEKASALVREDEKVAGEQAAVAQILKSECETELAQAIPILEDAISALNTLKPTDITLVKSMKNPPDAIKLVMAAVCVIKDVKPERIPDPSTGRKTIDYWGPSKRILGDMNFLQSLKDFDKDHIKPEIMVKIRKEYLPHKDFKPNVVAKASSAAEGLCKWIIAMDMYDKVAKEVAPKKEKLEKAEKEYAETMAVLNAKKEELTRLEKKLADLNEFLEEAKKEQLKLQNQVDYCNKKLVGAQKLIGSLSDERARWTEIAKNLESQYNFLPGNLLIFSGVVSYLAPLNKDLRNHLINIWHEHINEKLLPCSEEFDVIKLLSPDEEIQFWCRNEIPKDDFFVMSAIIRKYSRRFSIFVDPNYKASNWIQNTERKNKIILTKFNENYLEKLELAILRGKPILIHKIGEFIPPCLITLLQKQTFTENEDTFIILNSKPIKLNEDFRLYMTCNLSYPQFPPEMYNRVTLINFVVNEKALEKDLLKVVVEIEKPELKKLKKDISVRNKRDHRELVKFEGKILHTLCESEIDILENESAIQIIDESKALAKKVRESQMETDKLQSGIDSFTENYVDIAKYSANLFSCIDNLTRINHIYVFSLNWFMDQYFKSVLNAGKSKDTRKRCENIKSYFTYKLFLSIKNSLYRSDDLVFVFLLTTFILLFEERISKQDLDLFLEVIPKGKKEQWVNEDVVKCLEQIDGLQSLNSFLNDFKQNITTWQTFFEKPFIDLEDFIRPWNIKIENFHKLTLIKLLRYDQLFHNIKKFVSLELGEKFINTSHVDLLDIYNDSYSLSPIMIFLIPGINITQRLNELAQKKWMLSRLKVISINEEQMNTVDNFIEDARHTGSWILVQNCHLVPKWVRKLEENIAEMSTENTDENFRLWLTSKPSRDPPLELLQLSVKVVMQEPDGIKNKLEQIYKSDPIINTEFYNGCPEKFWYFSRLLYAVSFFHCALRVKRKFGDISTKAPYIFSDDDLNISQQQLQIFINKKAFNCTYLEKLIYFIGNCHYSGYIDNEWDVKLITTLLKDFLSTSISDKMCTFNTVELYGLPKKKDHKDYLLYISKLPDDDDPRLFGLNKRNLNYINEQYSRQLINSVFDTFHQQTKLNLCENATDLLLKVDAILSKLPLPSELKPNSISIGNVAITREIKQYLLLLDTVRTSLNNVKGSLNGDSRISVDTEETANNIVDNRVPNSWSMISYHHQMNLPDYIEDLHKRIQFFRQLIGNERNSFWLAAFFYPKSLICQMKIDFAKKENVPFENVVFDYEVLGGHKLVTSKGVLFDGFHIKGAVWDEENSKLSNPVQLYHQFPPILFNPINIDDFVEGNRYTCPIFQTDNVLDEIAYLHDSYNFICTVLLSTDSNLDQWIKRSVKILCQIPKQFHFS